MARIEVEDERQSIAATRTAVARISVETNGPGFTDITAAVRSWLRRQSAADGIVTLMIRHTSASLTIQENADPDVRHDLVAALARLAPEDAPYRHADEGPDDMPAHIKAVLTDTALTLPVVAGMVPLGTWQAIYLVEHRRAPHRREVLVAYFGS